MQTIKDRIQELENEIYMIHRANLKFLINTGQLLMDTHNENDITLYDEYSQLLLGTLNQELLELNMI